MITTVTLFQQPMYSVYQEDDDKDMERLATDREEMMRILLERQTLHTRRFNLLDAIISNDLKRLRTIPITAHNLNAESDEGLTPLNLAVMSANYEMCVHLLSAGAAVNYINQTNCTAFSAFVFEIANAPHPISVLQMRILLLLLRNGADASLPREAPAIDSLKRLGFTISGIYLRKIYSQSPKKEIDLYG